MVAIVVTLALGNLLITMLGIVATGQIAKVTLLPYPLLAAALFPLVFVAAFQSTTAWGDILVLLGAGMLGLAMKWLGWPRPPFILGSSSVLSSSRTVDGRKRVSVRSGCSQGQSQ